MGSGMFVYKLIPRLFPKVGEGVVHFIMQGRPWFSAHPEFSKYGMLCSQTYACV